nr:hypothetical protein [bacterium]
MKRVFATILVLVMALGLCACGNNKYAKYDHINEMLEKGDYDGAIMAIDDLRQQAQSGNENNGNNGDGENTKPSGEPTDQERDMLYDYYSIIRKLNSYLENGYINVYDEETSTSYDGSQALEYCYNRLSGMEAIDKWVGTEYVSSDRFSEEINWNRKAVLEDFAILKDVKLSESRTKTDNMGNVNTAKHAPWTYNENGALIHLDDEYYVDRIAYSDYNSYFQLEYDDNGRLLQKKYGTGGNVDALETYTYNAAGCLTNIHVKNNRAEYDYACTCDSQGRLIQIDWGNDYNDYTITYTYDNAGHLVKEEKTVYGYRYSHDHDADGKCIDFTYTFEYVYDGNRLTTGTYTSQNWSFDSEWKNDKMVITDNYPLLEQQNRYDYTCDSQGRVISCSVTPGNNVYIRTHANHAVGDIVDTPAYTNQTIETVYGDYYIYSPKN